MKRWKLQEYSRKYTGHRLGIPLFYIYRELMLVLSTGEISECEGLNIQPTCRKKGKEGLRKPKQVQDLHHLEENQLKVIYELCIIRMVFAHLALGQSGMTPLLHFISPQITSTFFKTWIFWIPPNKKVALSSEFLLFFIHNSILAPNTVDCKDAFICLFSSQSPNWTRWIAKLISGTGCVLLNSEHLIQNW